jgi:MFS family permease
MMGPSDPRPPRRTGASFPVRHLVLAWLCLAAAIAYIHRGCLAVPADTIQNELGLTRDQMGYVSSAFFLTYSVFQLPAAWLGGRWGSRLALPVFALVWTWSAGLMGLAGGFLGLLACRLAAGVAQAGLFPCSVLTFSHWYPPTQRALPNGALAACMSFGAVIATALTGFLLRFASWQAVFLGLTVPGVAWALLFWWWFRDRPSEHRWVSADELAFIRRGQPAGPAAPEAPPPVPWLQLFTSAQLGLVCLQQFFRAAGYVFFQTWFPTYLQKVYGVSVVDSGTWGSFPLLGVALGSLGGGVAADWVLARTGSRRLSRQGLAVAGLLACAALTVLAYAAADVLTAVAALTAGAVCFGVSGPASYTVTMDQGGRHVAAVFSLMNMSGNVGATVCPVAVTWLVTWAGERWEPVLLLLTGFYLVSTLGWLGINPNRGIFSARGGGEES